ncbi:transposase, partial [Salmonella enterica]|nr:transposase [Salmonella enterica]
MWVTAKECLGLGGLPTRDQNVRARLDSAVKGNPEWRRKREGTKAFEYHIDCLPPETREVLIERQAKQLVNVEAKEVEVTTKHRVTARDEVGIMEQCPAVVEQALHQLTDAQKAIASARILLAVEVHTLR